MNQKMDFIIPECEMIKKDGKVVWQITGSRVFSRREIFKRLQGLAEREKSLFRDDDDRLLTNPSMAAEFSAIHEVLNDLIERE